MRPHSHLRFDHIGDDRMKTSRGLFALTTANLLLLLLAGAQQLRPAFAQAEPPVLRGRALEIVDGQGRVRASINVLAAATSLNGEETHETVLLRLITERGRPSVKIAASELVSGLSFAGPTGTKDTYVILQAKGTASLLKLRNEDGREQVLGP
jgi:hypothetical protein